MELIYLKKIISLCNSLSEGQKRKLCIALIGNPKFVLLDEPTSGVDSISKKEFWKFLKDYKKDKIIILTSHSLDEAEYLGDRIGIINDGHFICSGTSAYLKYNYPCGFNINFIVNSIKFNQYNKQILFEKIKEFNNDSSIRIDSKEIFSINIKSINQKLYKIFNYIDNSKEKLEIKDYTINTTTLEDVFLKININNDLKNLIYKDKTLEKKDIIEEKYIYYKGFYYQLIAQIKRNLRQYLLYLILLML